MLTNGTFCAGPQTAAVSRPPGTNRLRILSSEVCRLGRYIRPSRQRMTSKLCSGKSSSSASITCWPGRISASSIMRSLIGCSSGPITCPQSFQPGAAAPHSFCCPALYLVGSNCCVLIVCLLLPILSLNVHPGQEVLAPCIVLISIHCGDGMGLTFFSYCPFSQDPQMTQPWLFCDQYVWTTTPFTTVLLPSQTSPISHHPPPWSHVPGMPCIAVPSGSVHASTSSWENMLVMELSVPSFVTQPKWPLEPSERVK